MSDRKKILITGANSGIGNALVHHFLNQKFEVTAIDKSTEKLNEEGISSFELDLLDQNKLQSFLKENIPYHNVLINCAGIREICPITELDFSLWQKVMGVNVDAAFIISKHFSELAITQGGGTIVNISSISGLSAEPNRNAYIASKHALIGLTKSMAFELGKFNIRVNAVAPGAVS